LFIIVCSFHEEERGTSYSAQNYFVFILKFGFQNFFYCNYRIFLIFPACGIEKS